ncbi:acidic mammalian chitinase-like isoform X2 [Artemia franciscana]|uniref:chitinase n=1 Tax=Artemia franciscana TaxID=6661 RepID=A0AA88L477_ARTSF|nr:hypothetical protein QYM36_005499 [Artemia franciscana]
MRNLLGFWTSVLLCVTAFAAIEAAKRNVVCYYGSWAVYRPGDGKFDVEDIDPTICTHLMFGFAALDNQTYKIVAFDPWNDLYADGGRGAYERFVALKNQNPRAKAILAIGGWNEGSVKYSYMAASPERRKGFVDSVVPFLQRYGFDGLDMDWEYPTQRGGVAEDRENFIELLRELKAAFAPYGLLLTAAVSPGEQVIDEAYDIPIVSELLDIINLMTYDYHGAWEQWTGHNAPLFAHPLDDGNVTNFNVNFTLNHWISNGAPPSKIHLGMPFYGRGFMLDDPLENGPYAPASEPLEPGPYSRTEGFWGYNEICEKQTTETGWTVVRNEYYKAPYTFKDRYWIGYDDYDSLTEKLKFVIAYDLGGAMVWSIETDDFRGNCHSRRFPLLHHVWEDLNGEVAPCVDCTVPTSAPPTNEQCPHEGYFAIDCTNYYYCQLVPDGGYQISYFTCPPGTAINVDIGGCDHDYNVPGCGLRGVV